MAVFALLFCVIFYADLVTAASRKKDLSKVNATKSVDLVSLLQEDLRKNNDDYKDVLPSFHDNDAVKSKLHNPYLSDGDAVLSDPENTGGRRNLNDKSKSVDKTPLSSTNNTNTNAKVVLRGKVIIKDSETKNNDVKNKNNESKKLMNDDKNRKTQLPDKNLNNHRIDIPIESNNKQTIVKKVEQTTKPTAPKRVATKMWNPHAGVKINNKNLMSHDKNIKGNQNLKTRLQDTRLDDKKRRQLNNRKSLDFNWGSKASGEGEVLDPTTARTIRQLRNDSRRGIVPNTKKANSPEVNPLHQMLDQEGLLHKFLRRGAVRQGGLGRGDRVRYRAAFALESDVEEVTPTAVPSAELDMLPATGERIETLRRKGRFCFRHILFPEGPKYDSRGRIYEPAHAQAVQHRDFASTRKPRMVLPRCCNCCKKSVLGCE